MHSTIGERDKFQPCERLDRIAPDDSDDTVKIQAALACSTKIRPLSRSPATLRRSLVSWSPAWRIP